MKTDWVMIELDKCIKATTFYRKESKAGAISVGKYANAKSIARLDSAAVEVVEGEL